MEFCQSGNVGTLFLILSDEIDTLPIRSNIHNLSYVKVEES